MKKLKFITASAAIAALTLTACQNDVDFTQEDAQNAAALDDNAIQFGTYLSESQGTRAGYEGSINTSVLQGLADGFGVFAYYTGTETYNAAQYGDWNAGALNPKYAPNFMYNQKVSYNSSLTNDYITKWTYEPLKYWPNEVGNTSTADDDQDENKSNNPATGSGTYGGNVSFFAYAPYTYVTVGDGVPENPGGIWANYNAGTTDGIVGITTNAALGDPKITYVIASDGNTVDLLWGTYNGTKENVVSETANNLGVQGDGDKNNDIPKVTDHTYAGTILDTYKLNADLTKQKTTGTVGFLFKHALAKIGGSTTVTDGGEAKNGFMVILDIDDMKGKESGGSLAVGETKVTINSIRISNDLNGDGDTGDTDVYGSGIDEMGTNKGVFNLATGQWTNTESVNNGLMSHTVYPTNTSESTVSATLNSAIAEKLSSSTHETVLFDAINKNFEGTTGTNNLADFFGNINDFASQTGVLSAKKLAVYDGTEANPLVFIPGTTPTLKITVDYFVRTKDANLQRGYSEVRQVITKLIQFSTPVELNKQYSLLMHLGLTSVKFTAEVSDWDVAYTDANSNGRPDPEEYDIKDVYLPRNVSELTAATTSTNYVGSIGGTFQIPNVSLVYSDPADNITISKDDFAAQNVTFTSSEGWATVDAATGVVTFTANESPYQRTTTITVKRGDSGSGNFQTATFELAQKGATLSSLSLSLSAPSTTTANLSVDEVATTNATFTHTTYNYGTPLSTTTYIDDVSNTAGYGVTGDGTGSFTLKNGTITFTGVGTATVTATYDVNCDNNDAFAAGSVNVEKTTTATVTCTAP